MCDTTTKKARQNLGETRSSILGSREPWSATRVGPSISEPWRCDNLYGVIRLRTHIGFPSAAPLCRAQSGDPRERLLFPLSFAAKVTNGIKEKNRPRRVNSLATTIALEEVTRSFGGAPGPVRHAPRLEGRRSYRDNARLNPTTTPG